MYIVGRDYKHDRLPVPELPSCIARGDGGNEQKCASVFALVKKPDFAPLKIDSTRKKISEIDPENSSSNRKMNLVLKEMDA